VWCVCRGDDRLAEKLSQEVDAPPDVATNKSTPATKRFTVIIQHAPPKKWS
jgi:hypothetical protein